MLFNEVWDSGCHTTVNSHQQGLQWLCWRPTSGVCYWWNSPYGDVLLDRCDSSIGPGRGVWMTPRRVLSSKPGPLIKHCGSLWLETERKKWEQHVGQNGRAEQLSGHQVNSPTASELVPLWSPGRMSVALGSRVWTGHTAPRYLYQPRGAFVLVWFGFCFVLLWFGLVCFEFLRQDFSM